MIAWARQISSASKPKGLCLHMLATLVPKLLGVSGMQTKYSQGKIFANLFLALLSRANSHEANLSVPKDCHRIIIILEHGYWVWRTSYSTSNFASLLACIFSTWNVNCDTGITLSVSLTVNNKYVKLTMHFLIVLTFYQVQVYTRVVGHTALHHSHGPAIPWTWSFCYGKCNGVCS